MSKKFRNRFHSPYESVRNHVGKKFEVLRKLSDEEGNIPAMYEIKLETGEKISAWAEEVENVVKVNNHYQEESEIKERTWLEDEEMSFPKGKQTRKGRAIWPDGKIRRVWAGLPDTLTRVNGIPAHGRYKGRYVKGFVVRFEGGAWIFAISDSHVHILEG